MNLNEKINFLFSLLVDEDEYKTNGIKYCASYWKMGTDILKMFDNLSKKLESVDTSFPICVKKSKHKTTEGDNDAYFLHINGINITPNKKQCNPDGIEKEFVAKYTIWQYVRTIIGFGLGSFDKKYNDSNSFILENGKIILKSNIKNLICKENWINLIKEVLVVSLFNNIKYLRDFAYSILFEICCLFKYDFKNLNEKNRIFKLNISIRGKGFKDSEKRKFFDLSNSNHLNFIKENIYRQGTNCTYKTIIEKISQNYDNLDELINDVYSLYEMKLNSYDNNYQDTISHQIEIQNLIASLKNNKNQFKNEIFKNRFNKGLIKNKNDLYSDLIVIDGNTNSVLTKFNESHACHIYEYKTIKNDAITNKENLEKYNDWARNPNNGLMMNSIYHSSFDRGQWFFDLKGNMVIDPDNEDYLLNNLGIKKVKINPKVFNDEMKQFLIKRNS